MNDRCGEVLRGDKVCARPAGHGGSHLSQAALDKAQQRRTVWADENRGKVRKSQVDWKRRNPEKHRARHIMSRYGLTADQYQQLLDAQGGVCWICEKRPKRDRHLAVDHDHRTGLVRGLCCDNCNYMLGTVHDNARLLTRAGEYLANPPAIEVIGEHRVPGAPPVRSTTQPSQGE